MALAHFRMLIYEFLNKDLEIVTEVAPMIVFDSKSDVCMSMNGKDTKYKRQIARRSNFVRNGEKCKKQNIDWCEGGLQLADIANNDVGEHDLTPGMKYIMLRLDN